jgi:hypothetical protein
MDSSQSEALKSGSRWWSPMGLPYRPLEAAELGSGRRSAPRGQRRAERRVPITDPIAVTITISVQSSMDAWIGHASSILTGRSGRSQASTSGDVDCRRGKVARRSVAARLFAPKSIGPARCNLSTCFHRLTVKVLRSYAPESGS